MATKAAAVHTKSASGGSASSFRELAGILRALEYLGSEAWPTLEAQTIRTLLEIATSGELPMQEIIKRVGMSGAAVSRNVDMLGDGKLGAPGLKWVEVNVDPADRRIKRVKLTAKGRAVVDTFADNLRRYMK